MTKEEIAFDFENAEIELQPDHSYMAEAIRDGASLSRLLDLCGDYWPHTAQWLINNWPEAEESS